MSLTLLWLDCSWRVADLPQVIIVEVLVVNTVSGNSYGIEVIGSTTDVYSNTAYSSLSTYAAIDVSGGNTNNVFRNLVYDNLGSGIVYESGTGHSIYYNIIYGHTSNSGYGIYLWGARNGTIIYNN